MKQKTPWFDIKAAVGNTRAQVFIFGVIVDYKWDAEDVTAKEFIDSIKTLGDFDLHINSPGGSVPAGNAIYNALQRHKGDVTVYIDGLAASMASVVAMGGARVIMPSNAMLMIHDPWSFASGNAADLRKVADTLDKFKTGLVDAYASKTGLDNDKIKSMMSEETWITAEQAVELGFADHTEKPLQAAAQFDLTRYRNVPHALAQQPPVLEANPRTGGKKTMKLEDLKKDHPDLVAQIEAKAQEGLITKANAETATAQAVSTETQRIIALINAAFGADTGARFQAVAAKGLTAEDIATLGIHLAQHQSPSIDAESRAQILNAIHAAAPVGMNNAAPENGEETERKSTISAIAAGGSTH